MVKKYDVANSCVPKGIKPLCDVLLLENNHLQVNIIFLAVFC